MTRSQRAAWLHECCRAALSRLNVEIVVQGEVPPSGLITANHLSYLDIMVLSAVTDCAFVAKSQVRHWPVFGWMATMSGTVYVDRDRPLATADVNEAVAAVLREGIRVVMFPESTSTDGSHVLPFRSSLFGSAVAERQLITPAFLIYQTADGNVATDVCYWGDMTFVPHLMRMLSLRHISTEVRFGPSSGDLIDRKAAATQMHSAVVALASNPPLRSS